VAHTAQWPHYPNKYVSSDHRNPLYDKSTSLICDGKLFRSPAAGKARYLRMKYSRNALSVMRNVYRAFVAMSVRLPAVLGQQTMCSRSSLL